ncbi:2-oxo acid dehydrogenase subunit E2 [Allopontixanthobacter sediminis]|uniref:Dihydrolipoamide acetyltransferase component of pyruvate dehydrogenase complex n=1 Tax=Allopontixanthobacter sediminis TaxID=1689985 RepID=A0A845B2F9_9SPHN|nr:2-oxo acid dehydrogenase subunit E2 [Allopontixanthobacter sediminis]MXP43617.1 pyruvate dehydrogenase complex dihydrolipoamide acetyltransferase [Allopontixanthobacter sediminis]
MPTPIKMPALSPTMEEGTLARWLVKVGDKVSSGDIMAEIETDKATMEFEAVDEGTIVSIDVDEGSEGVKVGTVIATLAGEDEDASDARVPAKPADTEQDEPEAPAPAPASSEDQILISPSARKIAEERGVDLSGVTGTGPNGRIVKADVENAPAGKPAEPAPAKSAAQTPAPTASPAPSGDRIIASPLAKRIAEQKGIDLASLTGSGPNGRIIKADVDGAKAGAAAPKSASEPAAAPSPAPATDTNVPDYGIPFEAEKLNNIRKTIARRLTEAKQTIPHIYLTLDVRLDALLKLRSELNAALEPQGIKLSVNDLLIKGLAKALQQVPSCNVSFAGDVLRKYSRTDISVAVAAPSGLITPIIVDAANKSISAISIEMKELAGKARDGKLQPHEFQGGTASLSNLGMFGIKQFDAVINPPQAMILAVGAGEKRPAVTDGALSIATVMSATGSFDHRAIDGADGAQLMQAFQQIVENPLGLVA